MICRILGLGLLLLCFNSIAFADNKKPITVIKTNGNHIRYEFTNPNYERIPHQGLIRGEYSAHIIDINGRIAGQKIRCQDIKDYLHDQMFYEILENPCYYSIQLDCDPDQSGLR